MGVPAFFRWLSEKYPKILQDVLEERISIDPHTNQAKLPFDWSGPNPSGVECDNLYIDMNGIIHPCAHPETGPQPANEEEMYENVCKYVDRLVRVLRPRKLLYLAIDGVAPRAKMNQQRARRFRSAQEARELQELETNVRNELAAAGEQVPELAALKSKPWDSNVITPGTPFMLKIATFLRFYIRKRISTDSNWKNIRVMFSDASLPGEGEHKIMSHIRLQRSHPGYDPNTVHILHGLDADLIMLALATHEAHFYISREEVLFGRKSAEQQERRQMESGFADKQKALNVKVGIDAMELAENQQKPIQRVSIPVLREYLAVEFAVVLRPGYLPFAPSLERLIDDVVFLCFFVGNDFLPHLPSLDIRDGALDFLFNVYKRLLPAMGRYITESGGKVSLRHVDVILAEVGAIEDHVFGMKHENELREQERRKEMRAQKKRGGDKPPENPVVDQHQVRGRAARVMEKQQRVKDEAVALSRGHKVKVESRQDQKARKMMKLDNDIAAEKLRAILGQKEVMKKEEEDVKNILEAPLKTEDTRVDKTISSKRRRDAAVNEDNVKVKTEAGVVGEAEVEFDVDDGDEDEDDTETKIKVDDALISTDPAVAKSFKEKLKVAQGKKLDGYSQSVVDKVRLHEAGWKDRYYSDKCKADDISENGGRENMFRSYVMGLCWVMKYYYDGCPSWKWYYPYHYGPFASDLKNIERFEKDCRSFELGKPFNPVEQLLAVLPSDSKHAVPKPAQWLMDDPESPILEFYPTDVPVDPNGKAMPWLWVVLLPFIDEERLLAAMSGTMPKWNNDELLCNARGLDDGYLYMHREVELSKKLATALKGKTATATKMKLSSTSALGKLGFSGSVRPPLSNEHIPVDEDISLSPPGTAGRIESRGEDSIFVDTINPNEAICVAFTEPPKLSHKSVLLPGVKLLPPTLNDDDKRIRRPRLNRGGGTIANLGTGNGQSHNSGYGSMNISSYERDLAQRNGRGNQIQQVGTRAWGAMEPTPKRIRNSGPPPPQTRNNYEHNQGFNVRSHWYQGQQHYDQGGRQHRQHPFQGYNSSNGQNAHHGGYSNQQQHRSSHHGSGPGGYHHQAQSFDFRQQANTHAHSHGQNQMYRQQQNQARVGPDVMSNLRAQLNNTLRRHQQGGNSNNNSNHR